jgi:hypothetical protein
LHREHDIDIIRAGPLDIDVIVALTVTPVLQRSLFLGGDLPCSQ